MLSRPRGEGAGPKGNFDEAFTIDDRRSDWVSKIGRKMLLGPNVVGAVLPNPRCCCWPKEDAVEPKGMVTKNLGSQKEPVVGRKMLV